MHRDAGIGGNADRLVARGTHLCDHIVEVGVRLQKLADRRSDALPFLRKTHPVSSAVKQRKTDLALQRVHHMRQSGLRIAQHLRRFGETAQIHRHEQRL